MLLPCGHTIFQKFVLVIGVCIGATVERLLIEQLSLQQVAHLRGARLIIVTIQAQILLGLLNAALGYQELLARLLDVVPGVIHTYLQQL